MSQIKLPEAWIKNTKSNMLSAQLICKIIGQNVNNKNLNYKKIQHGDFKLDKIQLIVKNILRQRLC